MEKGKKACSIILWRGTASLRRLSTATVAATSSAAKDKETSLYRRLSALGGSDLKVADTLNEWVSEGKPVRRFEAIGYINQLRKYKKYEHAIQLLEWIENRGRKFTHGDHAIRIDLLSKVKGVAAAEQYFNGLRESAKTKETYGALLNCFCQEKMTDKAMALFKEMERLKFASTLAYKNLMCLRMSLGEHKKVQQLAQEMKQKNIPQDVFVYNILMNSYASLKDIEGVERVMEEMKAADGIQIDWATYANLATIYVKAGQIDKANTALTELEKMDNLRDRDAFLTLISLYAQTSNSLGVNRVWKSLKSAFPKTINSSYLVMLRALSRLGDMDALSKCCEEWESACSIYDVRLANVLIDAYLNRGMIKDAELVGERIKKRGAKPDFRTLEMFMTYYLKNKQLDLALKYVDMAASKVKAEKSEWKLNQETLNLFLKYFEEKKDVDGVEKFYDSLKQADRVSTKVYESLLRTYIAAGRIESQMRKRIKDDGIEMSSETKKLLERVCPS
ncbi:pentatricopeptide repeat-containing protein At4g01990, mitochondrial-like [Macadamia integrifolia]|uniref:pentatricopeptide repeat-containing protein At4g01990, mitochondrial-like n=1 Tax=Macadamia integrifolia TaxID=60698 RepID=UPI001C4F3A14|nr:pentatricopeptide repeat-containing protein At4g01990, mitochondrial-like [Macadamia integrifolia]